MTVEYAKVGDVLVPVKKTNGSILKTLKDPDPVNTTVSIPVPNMTEVIAKTDFVYEGATINEGEVFKVHEHEVVSYKTAGLIKLKPGPKKGAKASQPATAEEVKATPAQSVAAPVLKPIPSSLKPKSQTVAMTEELLGLEQIIAAGQYREALARYDELKKLLSAVIADSGVDPAVPYTFYSEVGTVTFSPAVKTTVITDESKMLAMLGSEVATKIAKFNLTDIKKYLSEIQLDEISTKSWGPRKLQAVNPNKPEA